MQRNNTLAFWCGLAAAAATLFIATRPAAAKARNIILMIADGSGYNSYLAADYYEFGRAGQQVYEQDDWVKYACRTTPLTRSSTPTGEDVQDEEIQYDAVKAWDTREDLGVVDWKAKLPGAGAFKGYNFLKMTYTDSAAAITALASGVKTYNNSIDFFDGPSKKGAPMMHQTIAELASARGLSCGAITSVEWSHATPAGAAGTHNISRNNYAAIADEILLSRHMDVIMGAGHPEFDNDGLPREPQKRSDYKYVGGPESWDMLKRGTHPGGWTLVQTKAEFEALTSGPTPLKVCGTAQVDGTLQQARSTRDWNHDGYVDDVDKRCAPAYGDPFSPNLPTLATMSRAALNVLNNRHTGFFLMIEGGAVDWANHANQAGRMIEEQIEFNKAIRAVVDWVNVNSNWDETLVIITADHETGLIWGPESDRIPFQPIINNGAGNMPGMRYNTGNHSNSLIGVWAKGPGLDQLDKWIVGYDPKRGAYIDNTDIFRLMKSQLPGVDAASNGKRKAAKEKEQPVEEPEGQ